MYKRILVATDGSKLSRQAVTTAIDLAALAGAELVALKVVPRYPKSYFEGSVPLSMEELTRIEKQWTEEGQSVVDAVRDEALERGDGDRHGPGEVTDRPRDDHRERDEGPDGEASLADRRHQTTLRDAQRDDGRELEQVPAKGQQRRHGATGIRPSLAALCRAR